jgi:hypothetical protein
MALRSPVSRTLHVLIGNIDSSAMPATIVLDFTNYPRHTEGLIEENKTAFFCMNIFFGLSMCIMKNTDEGEQLKEMLKMVTTKESVYSADDDRVREFTADDLRDWLCSMIAKHIHVKVLDQRIRTLMADSYTKGKRNAQANMRDALGFPSDMV